MEVIRDSAMKQSFVVKVQLSLLPSTRPQTVLVYNRSRSVMWEGLSTPQLAALVGSGDKAYFHAHLQGTLVALDGVIPEGSWPEW